MSEPAKDILGNLQNEGILSQKDILTLHILKNFADDSFESKNLSKESQIEYCYIQKAEQENTQNAISQKIKYLTGDFVAAKERAKVSFDSNNTDFFKNLSFGPKLSKSEQIEHAYIQHEIENNLGNRTFPSSGLISYLTRVDMAFAPKDTDFFKNLTFKPTEKETATHEVPNEALEAHLANKETKVSRREYSPIFKLPLGTKLKDKRLLRETGDLPDIDYIRGNPTTTSNIQITEDNLEAVCDFRDNILANGGKMIDWDHKGGFIFYKSGHGQQYLETTKAIFEVSSQETAIPGLHQASTERKNRTPQYSKNNLVLLMAYKGLLNGEGEKTKNKTSPLANNTGKIKQHYKNGAIGKVRKVLIEDVPKVTAIEPSYAKVDHQINTHNKVYFRK